MTITRAEAEAADYSDIATGERLAPVTPGEVLREDFMVPLGLSANALAHDMGVPPESITGILNDEQSMTARTALDLARRFGTSAEFWMNLQTMHELEMAQASDPQ